MGFRVRCEKCGQVHYTDEACSPKIPPEPKSRKSSMKVGVDLAQPGSEKTVVAKHDERGQIEILSDTCPTCGQRTKPMTGAERQRAYRKRKNA